MGHRGLVAITLLLLAARLHGADVYLAPPPTGADTHAGTPVQPMATIAKAIAVTAAGDRIFLRRGGTWRETFTLQDRHLLAEPGAGPAPTVTASTVVAGPWTAAGAVLTAPVDKQVLAVWVNGTFLHLARYPNTGWLRAEAGTSADRIVTSELPKRDAGRWSGAQVRWRRWSWWWETRTITGDSGGNALDLVPTDGRTHAQSGVGGNSPDGKESCFYIDNSRSELDAPGEWWWGDGQLRLIPPAGVDPATMTVEVVTSRDGIACSGATVQGIAFRRFEGRALTFSTPGTVDGCAFEEIGDTAVECSWNSAPVTIRHCIFRDVRNVAINCNQDPAARSGTVFERNLLHRIGMDPGYGGSGSWHASGIILVNGHGVIVRLNRIVDTGYCGVIVGRAGQTVTRNVLVRTLSTLNDGAAVYTNCSKTLITENIILDVCGDLSTSMPWFPLGQGIWPEFLKDFHDQTITDNTVFGCNGNGIMLIDEYTCTVARNVLVDNRRGGMQLGVILTAEGVNDYGVAENADDDLRPQQHVIEGNIIAIASPTHRLSRPEHLTKWHLPPYSPPQEALFWFRGQVDYGTVKDNIFIAPAEGTDLFVSDNPKGTWDSVPQASAANAWIKPENRLVRGHAYLLINDTETPACMTVPVGDWTMADGSKPGQTLTVAPFRSAVLVTTGPLPAAPYVAASGIDWRAKTPTNEPLRSLAPQTSQPANP